jgi:hypothetical protein
VRVVDAERDPAASAPPLALTPVRQWLLARGFALVEPPWQDGVRRDEVLAEFFQKDGELSEVVLTFTLSRASPEQWPAWQQVVESLCGRFGLLLGDSEALTKAPPEHLFPILTRDLSWREFHDRFHWPDPPQAAHIRSPHVVPLAGDALLPQEQIKP